MISQKITVSNPSGLHLQGICVMKQLSMNPELNFSLAEEAQMPKAF